MNNRFQMGGTASAMAERRQAHIPLLLHPNPRRALFLGPGTGITLGAASGHTNLFSDGVELVPEILDVMPFFQPENNGPFLRTHLVVADARRFVRVTTNQYDVIVGDLFHPALDGAGFLYTREHFEAIRTRLQQDGLFCQWLPIHQLDDSTLRVIVRTFLEVFPDTHGILLHFNVDIPVLGLIGTVQPLRPSLEFLEQRMRDGDLALRLKAVGLDRPISLLGSLAASPNDLRNYAKDAPLNTDDHPLVTFLAPRVNNLNGKSVGERLLKFLDHCSLRANELVLPSANSDVLVQNLGDFLVARDLYLRGLVEEGRGRLPAAIDLYLESARRSLHFTSAYARCVTIIQVMNNTDRRGALSLFQRLEEAQPAQPLGRKLLGPLFQERK